MKSIYCKRCGNSDPSLFGWNKGKPYCKACIEFKGKMANIPKKIKPKIIKANLSYKLTKQQEIISSDLINSNKEIYIDAVCGSGKTEIILKSIENSIFQGERVGFVAPRREVIVDIFERLKGIFPTLNVIAVYGGHTEFLNGDIVCLTCHQCYRYKGKFGLIILDEYDAFPLKGNEPLMRIVQRSSYNKKIYMSATFSEQFLREKDSFSLNRRHHGYDIPVPRIIKKKLIFQIFNSVNLIRKNKVDTIFIFVPTIAFGKTLKIIYKILFLKPILFTSKTKDKTTAFKKIKSKENKIIICTTILERGITVSRTSVLVLNSEHKLFDVQTLIQICGRAGRNKEYPEGKVIFYASKITESIKNTIDTIENKNSGYEL